MAFSDAELQQLYGDLSPVGVSPFPVDTNAQPAEVPYKRIKQVANIIPASINALSEGVAGLSPFLDPSKDYTPDIKAAGHIAPTFNVGQNTGITDVALNNILPQIAAWSIPYAGIGKIAKVAQLGEGVTAAPRLGQILSEGLSQGGANLVMSDSTEKADQGGLGLASGILQTALPRWQRALPLAGVSALEGYKSSNWVGAGANFAFNMLPGAASLKEITKPVISSGSYDAINSLLHPELDSGLTDTQYSQQGLDSMDAFSGIKNSGLKLESPESRLRALQNEPVSSPTDELPSGLKLWQQPDLQSEFTVPNVEHVDLGNPVEADPNADIFSNLYRDPSLRLENPAESALRRLQTPDKISPIETSSPSGLRLASNSEATAPGEPKVRLESDLFNASNLDPHADVFSQIMRPIADDSKSLGEIDPNADIFFSVEKGVVAKPRKFFMGKDVTDIPEVPPELKPPTLEENTTQVLPPGFTLLAPHEHHPNVKFDPLGASAKWRAWRDGIGSAGEYESSDEAVKGAWDVYNQIKAAKKAIRPVAAVKGRILQKGKQDKAYRDLADETSANKENTKPIKPKPEEKQAILEAYKNLASKSDFPSISITHVLEEAGFKGKGNLRRGKGIIAEMNRTGDIQELSTGDWTHAEPKVRAGGVQTSGTNGPALLMRIHAKAPVDFATEVQKAVNSIPPDFGDKKRFIGNVYDAFVKNGNEMPLEEFKGKLMKSFNENPNYTPSRLDLVGAFLDKKPLIEKSRVGDSLSDFHFLSPNEVKIPKVQMPDGTMMNVQPLKEGPHIISTVLTDEKGITLAGNKWNTVHNGPPGKLDYPSIMNQQMDGPNLEQAFNPGIKSGFLLSDKNGNIRVTTNRVEALEIAKLGGQTTKVEGELHSQDLIEAPNPPAPKNVQEHKIVEKVNDAKDLEAAKNEQQTVAQLQANLDAAKALNDPVRIRIAARQLSDHWDEVKIKSNESRYHQTGEVDMAADPINPKRMRKREGGFADPKVLGITAAAGIGGLITYQQTKGDMGATLAAAVIIAGIGIGGTKALQELKAVKGLEESVGKIKVPNETVVEKLKELRIETLSTPAGLAVGGRGGIYANAVKGAEDMFGLNRMDFYKDVKVLAGGFVDDILQRQQKALKEVAKIKPTDAFADSTQQYIRGQLNDPAVVQNLLNSGGVISSEGGAWGKMSAADKANFPEKWMQLDDPNSTNTKGDGVTIWHVTNSVKQQLVQGEQDALRRLATTPEDQKFMQYAFDTRGHFDELMQVIHDAAGPKEAQRLIGTAGQYVTRSHALITDPKFYPDEATIQKTMDNLSHYKINEFLSSVEAGPVPIQYGTQTYNVTAVAADQFNNLFTPESLRAVVTQQIKELKQIGAQKAKGIQLSDTSQLQGGLFTGRKEIDAVRQALLGTHTAPLEMIQSTFNKLLPAAHSADAMLRLTKAVEESGLPARFESEIEFNKAINNLKGQLMATSDARVQRVLQRKIDDLSAYIPLGNDNPAFGLFQGSYVSRHLNAQIGDILEPFGELKSVMGTGMSKFTSLFKETHLVWNPVVQARNAVQVPMFLVMGRAAHDMQALTTAYDVVFKDATSEIGQWVTRNGAMSGNPVKGELQFGFRELLDGTADNKIFAAFQKTRQFLHSMYAKPDDFTRVAVFLAAAKREAVKLGVPIDRMHLSQEVTDTARQFMNRRAMDYGNVPNWVKAARQVPILSTFLTYSHEIVRITKNMAIDSIKDPVSAAGLAGLSVMPFLAQSMAENQLSPKDKADWLRGNNATQDYSRPRFKMPMSRNADGSFNYYDITALMPFGDYLGMGKSIANNDWMAAATTNPIMGLDNSPLLNVAAAQIAGKDLHTQRDFRGSWDRVKNVLASIAPPLTPGIGPDWQKLAPEELGGSLGQTNIVTGRTSTIAGALLRNTTGLDSSQLNPDMAVKSIVQTAQHDIANEGLFLKDALLAKGLSDSAKQRAIENYVKAVKHITDELSERVKP